MKKLYIFSFLLLIFISGNIFAENGDWFWSHPKPTGSHLEDVFFVNENIGYTVGFNGTILKTTNSGVNWIQLKSNMNLIFYSVYFTSEDTGYIASGDMGYPTTSVIIKTTNGGINWNNVSSFSNVGLRSLFFVNNDIGYAAGLSYWMSGRLYKTTNGGEFWTQIYTILNSNFNSVSFLNEDTGFIAADYDVLVTTNAGINWARINGSGISAQNLYFLNGFTGYTCGIGGTIFKTTNSGLNWNQLNSGVTNPLWDIEFKDFNTGFAVGGATTQNSQGKFLRTTNAGAIWNLIDYNSTESLLGLYKLNDSSLISVGNSGTLLKSNNSGINFIHIDERVTSNIIKDIRFMNENTGIAVGYNSTILRTTNQGNNWINISLGNNYQLNSIAFTNSVTAYATGGYSVRYPYPPYYFTYYLKTYKTTDAGGNWNLILGNNNEQGYGNKVLFINQNTGYIGSMNGIIRTNNSGLNWFTAYSSVDVKDIFFIDSSLGFACGQNGVFLKTTNSGFSWYNSNVGVTNNALFSVYFPSSQIGYIAGDSVILKTTNGGSNWQRQYSGIQYECDFYSIHFSDNNTGYAVGFSDGELMTGSHGGGEIIKTTNGGLNWIHESTRYNLATILDTRFYSICFVNQSTAFVVGENGVIIKNSNVLHSIGIQSLSSEIPYSFFLEQNYPNPFNPVTKIKFQIPLSRGVSEGRGVFTKIIIYDLLGREITTLVNEQFKPGTYEVDWDGTGFASGVYFYSLVTESFVETKRMVLIK